MAIADCILLLLLFLIINFFSYLFFIYFVFLFLHLHLFLLCFGILYCVLLNILLYFAWSCLPKIIVYLVILQRACHSDVNQIKFIFNLIFTALAFNFLVDLIANTIINNLIVYRILKWVTPALCLFDHLLFI